MRHQKMLIIIHPQKNDNHYASFTNWKFTLKVSMKKGALKVRAGRYEEEEEEDRVCEVKSLRAGEKTYQLNTKKEVPQNLEEPL